MGIAPVFPQHWWIGFCVLARFISLVFAVIDPIVDGARDQNSA